MCDAIKKAIKIDDRWFCIRRLDWEIIKTNPKLYVGVGQTSNEDVRICSYCGRILPLDRFIKDNKNRLGVRRECNECRVAKKFKL